MDIPMINEINDNTNAAAEAVKNAILNAMPAAGIDQTALDAAVAEIVAAMPTTSASSAQTKKFTTIHSGSASSTKKTISGSGFAAFYCNSTDVEITVDGTSLSGVLKGVVWCTYFEKSIALKGRNSAVTINYLVRT